MSQEQEHEQRIRRLEDVVKSLGELTMTNSAFIRGLIKERIELEQLETSKEEQLRLLIEATGEQTWAAAMNKVRNK